MTIFLNQKKYTIFVFHLGVCVWLLPPNPPPPTHRGFRRHCLKVLESSVCHSHLSDILQRFARTMVGRCSVMHYSSALFFFFVPPPGLRSASYPPHTSFQGITPPSPRTSPAAPLPRAAHGASDNLPY